MPKRTGRERASTLKFVLALLILLIDQLSKKIILEWFELGETLPLIQEKIHLTLVYNTGTAFGLFPQANTLLILLSVVIIVFLVYLLYNESNQLMEWLPLTLILGGAIGNLTDRVMLGYVVDFIDLRFWPVFNIADSCISIGITWILINSLCTQASSK